MDTVIINSSLFCMKFRDVCKNLEHDFNVRYVNDAPFDILFPMLKPAFALNVYNLSKLMQKESQHDFVLRNRYFRIHTAFEIYLIELLPQINRILQDKFKIYLTLIIIDQDYEVNEINNLLCQLLGINARILYCKHTEKHIIDIIRSYYQTLHDAERKQQQLKYFQTLQGTNATKEICFNLFKSLEVIVDDWSILIDATPSISCIISSKKDDMLEQNPCEINTILKISSFAENYRN